MPSRDLAPTTLPPVATSLYRYIAVMSRPVPSRPSCPIPDLICQRRDANTDLPLESLGQRLVSTRPSRDPHAPNSSPVANSLSPRTRRLQRRRRRNAPWRWLKCLHTFLRARVILAAEGSEVGSSDRQTDRQNTRSPSSTWERPYRDSSPSICNLKTSAGRGKTPQPARPI